MPIAVYQISETEASKIGSLENLFLYYTASAEKSLQVALDPLVDSTILDPSQAYSQTEN